MRFRILTFALALFGLTSCIKDRPIDINKDLTFVVSISVPNLPNTKAIDHGSAHDNKVDEICILLFKPGPGGAWDGYAQAFAIEDFGAGHDNWKKFKVSIEQGSYKALFIANATDRINALCDLSNGTYRSDNTDIDMANIQTRLQGVSILPRARYNADTTDIAGGYHPFYLSSEFIDLTIPLTVDYSQDPIKLTRDVARINFEVANPTLSGAITLDEIHLCNYNTNDYIVPAAGWWTLPPAPLFAPYSGVTRPISWQTGPATSVIYSVANGAIKSNKCVQEIFTYENKADTLCLLIKTSSVTVNGVTQNTPRWYKVDFRYKDLTDNKIKPVNILRNYSYLLTVTDVKNFGHATAQEAFDAAPEGLVIDMDAGIDDPGLNYIKYNGTYRLSVDKIQVFFYHNGGTEPLQVFTNYSNGWTIDPASFTGGWLTASAVTPALGPPNIVPPAKINITTAAFSGTAPRTASFKVSAGALSHTIEVIQFPAVPNIPDNFSAVVTPFVGAFWKAEQWGERLIRIPRPASNTLDGAWMAAVLEGRDWIVLDTLKSVDNTIWTASPQYSGNGAGFDAINGVYGTETIVQGDLGTGLGQRPDIYFRIGLKTAYTPTPTEPVRYGVVLLWNRGVTGYTQRIWIRQGEGVDYLMRPNDAGTNLSGVPLRPDVVRFSPYNLSASSFNTPLPLNGGQFTDYPSQAGAFFQWANANNLRYAYPPVGSVSNWQNNYPSLYWMGGATPLSDAHETCPPGFSRPMDGSATGPNTAGPVAGSEVRQSLWQNPVAGLAAPTPANSAAGYYADGFFDRRLITTSASGNLLTAVSPTGNDVAYKGSLYFNTSSFASLFFPLAGSRLNSDGTLNYTGFQGHYWSASSYDATQSWRMYLLTVAPLVSAQMSYTLRSHGLSIRCVECIGVQSVTLAAGSNSAAIGSTLSLTAASVPPNSTNVRYLWEYNVDGGWTALATTTVNTYSSRVFREGTNLYRVTAYNGCGNALSNVVSVTGTMPLGPEPEPNILMYAGAFWRANQRGERLIRINVGAANLNNSGPWVASVSFVDAGWNPVSDGVVLSNAKTSDTYAYSTTPYPTGGGSLPNKTVNWAENFQVYPASDTTFIMGNAPANTYIEFRIGLKTTYSATSTAPARYAVVMLFYGDNKVRRLFLRQGEGADYLMRPGDAGTGVPAGRPTARKIASFNLKHPQNIICTHRNSANFGTNYGVFTEFPSMSGFIFSFNSGSPMFGTGAINGLGVGGWSNQLEINGWWSGMNFNPETCPPGYHRPNDGPTASAGQATVANSEMRQSFWVDPPAGVVNGSSPSVKTNSTGGIYADGYFDRGVIDLTGSGTNSAGKNTVYYNNGLFTPAPTVVGNGTTPPVLDRVFVAASGRLFFNPSTNASLFMPATGVTNQTTGSVSSVGEVGGYWTSTSYGNSSSSYGSLLQFDIDDSANGNVFMGSYQGRHMQPIRCVAN